MNGKTALKLLLDLVMTVLFVLLIWNPGTGWFFHEVAGIGIGLLFLLHVALNWKPAKCLARKALSGTASAKGMFMLLLDGLLSVGMTVVILTGIFLSRILFNIDVGIGRGVLYQIHSLASYVCLAVLAAHLLVHAKYLANAVRQFAARWKDSSVRRVTVRFAAASMALGLLYLYAFSSYQNGSAALASGTVPAASASTSSDSTASSAQEDKKKQSGDTSTSAGSSDAQQASVSLSEYLSKLYCTGCHNHCPLSNPQCGRSYQQIQEATEDYQEQYSVG